MLLPSLCLAAALIAVPDPGTRRLQALHGPPGATTSTATGNVQDPHATAAAFDLFAACLRAGMPAASAAGVVAESAPPVLAAALRRGADRLKLGADPADAWSAEGDLLLEDFARAARRSAKSGAPLSDIVSELAVRHRSDAEDEAAGAIERAGVLVSGPLGLCFLPAFVCLGIVPVVIGLARGVLGSGLL
ncbi:type II secretion system F family protein [Rhodococcus sp. HNM0563]|uniref:type II secretion system F family protein n=1 Tax=unclassified Rhodococcus (in: high G+C Gram-positive bacteria) TaxID=192944 RepID=UPI00146C68AD|nr:MULTISPECIES: type II secretion system F family protein [unclassified Rhodococcus (in: high G+C Gram-positive bacteria)]MCK0093675.1 type II secretion system F family protein [Rhodococcus sp. F64268]NLU65232.1 type II secretion system F family protein [Rhodococcus sp. HNM0563]